MDEDLIENFSFEEENIDYNIEEYYLYTLKQIDKIEDIALKKEILKLYKKDIENSYSEVKYLNDTISLLKNAGESILTISKTIKKIQADNISTYFFPGDIILIYNKITTHKTTKRLTCDFCSEVIYPDSTYEEYRPLIYNFTTKKSYLLKRSLKSKGDCQHYFPTNIREMEMIQEYTDNSYELQYSNEDDIFPNKLSLNRLIYEEFDSNTGGFNFIQLNKNKNKKKTKKKIFIKAY